MHAAFGKPGAPAGMSRFWLSFCWQGSFEASPASPGGPGPGDATANLEDQDLPLTRPEGHPVKMDLQSGRFLRSLTSRELPDSP